MKHAPITLAGKQWSVLSGTLIVLIGGIFIISLLVDAQQRRAVNGKASISQTSPAEAR